MMDAFYSHFHFDRLKTLYVGVEREFFIGNMSGVIVPDAPRIIKELCADTSRYSYELSACQLEVKVGPVKIECLFDELSFSEQNLIREEHRIGFRRLHTEVGPDDMPLDIYPDPTGRCARIAEGMSQQELLAACQIIGTHVHIGMPDHATALQVYNHVIPYCTELCRLGDNSGGRRLQIYRRVTPSCEPQPYSNWNEFYQAAVSEGFADNPRDCWTLIRISRHGTIEFRMLGTTDSLPTIVSWARTCYDLCASAIR